MKPGPERLEVEGIGIAGPDRREKRIVGVGMPLVMVSDFL
jgi:hypothetical protein